MLLIGAWGTQASWTDSATADGTDVGSGHLKLVNAHCDGWLIGVNLNDPNPITFNPAALKLTPGNVLTQVCTFEVDALGYQLAANLSVSTPQITGDGGLVNALQVSADYERGTTPIDSSTTLSDGDVVTATLHVAFPDGGVVNNLTQDLAATLEDITVTASQA